MGTVVGLPDDGDSDVGAPVGETVEGDTEGCDVSGECVWGNGSGDLELGAPVGDTLDGHIEGAMLVGLLVTGVAVSGE